jgi:N utilization substance protein B
MSRAWRSRPSARPTPRGAAADVRTRQEAVVSRRQAREQVVQWLYEADVGKTPAESLVARPVPGLRADDRAFADALFAGVNEKLGELDAWLGRLARAWRVDRMAVVDRAILRLGLYELRYRPDVPASAVLAEAVELADRFSTAEARRFINGVLSRAAEEAR